MSVCIRAPEKGETLFPVKWKGEGKRSSSLGEWPLKSSAKLPKMLNACCKWFFLWKNEDTRSDILPEIWKIKGEVEIVRTHGKNETDNRNASLWEFKIMGKD